MEGQLNRNVFPLLTFEPSDLKTLTFCMCTGHEHSSPGIEGQIEVGATASRGSAGLIMLWHFLGGKARAGSLIDESSGRAADHIHGEVSADA